MIEAILYPNGSVLDEVRRILVHLQNIQTCVVNNVIYDNGVANTLFTTSPNVHDTDPGSARRCHKYIIYDIAER